MEDNGRMMVEAIVEIRREAELKSTHCENFRERTKPTVYLTPEVGLVGDEISCGHVGCEAVHARGGNKYFVRCAPSLFPFHPMYRVKQVSYSRCRCSDASPQRASAS